MYEILRVVKLNVELADQIRISASTREATESKKKSLEEFEEMIDELKQVFKEK